MDSNKLDKVINVITSNIKKCDIDNIEEILREYINNSNLYNIVELDIRDGKNGELHQSKCVIRNDNNFLNFFKTFEEFLDYNLKFNIKEHFRTIDNDFIKELSYNCSNNSNQLFGEIPTVDFDKKDVESLFRFMSNVNEDMVMIICGDKAISKFYNYSHVLNIQLKNDKSENYDKDILYVGNYQNFNIYNYYKTMDNEILIYPKEEMTFLFDRILTDIIVQNEGNSKIIRIMGEYKFVCENINDFVKFSVV